MGRLRATAAEEKDARRRQILAAAAALLEVHPFAEITMRAVAERAGLAKGTIYLYFQTREELFLGVFEELVQEWLSELAETLGGEKGALCAEDLGAMVASSLAARPLLIRLMNTLHAVLETNIGLETARAFKKRLLRLLAPMAGSLERRLPAVRGGGALELLLQMDAAIVGVAQLASPAPVIAEALRDPELAPFRIDLELLLSRMIAALTRGFVPSPQTPTQGKEHTS